MNNEKMQLIKKIIKYGYRYETNKSQSYLDKLNQYIGTYDNYVLSGGSSGTKDKGNDAEFLLIIQSITTSDPNKSESKILTSITEFIKKTSKRKDIGVLEDIGVLQNIVILIMLSMKYGKAEIFNEMSGLLSTSLLSIISKAKVKNLGKLAKANDLVTNFKYSIRKSGMNSIIEYTPASPDYNKDKISIQTADGSLKNLRKYEDIETNYNKKIGNVLKNVVSKYNELSKK